jgi:hypothetical protein
MRNTIFILVLFTIVGCASNPNDIHAAYVSPLKYKDYTCDQLAMEMDHVANRTTRLNSSLQKKRSGDNWQMGVGLVLFWPALFALEGGDGAEAAEFSQLKGEFEALRGASVKKNCGIDRRSPEQIIANADEQARTEAVKQVDEHDVKHREQVRGIAQVRGCGEYASLIEATEQKETWLLGCGNGVSLTVQCANHECVVQN